MDVSNAIVAKSDQLNAIDLVGRDVTVTIVDVKQGPSDQPVHIITDLYGPSRPWKASKTSLRDIVQVWGTDATVWVGRRITLFNDPEVLWAGKKVGGVRIRAMSHIDAAFKATHIITRGKTQDVMIQPLPNAPTTPQQPPIAPFLDAIDTAATMDALKAAWVAADNAGLGKNPELWEAKERRKKELE